MNYLEFFGLKMEPFSSAPDSRFYYNSAQHSKALTRLMYAVESMKGLAVLIGDIGTGKTTLARRMLDSLPEEEYEPALLVIIHSGITADWLLKKIALQLGVVDPVADKLKLLSQLYDRLMFLHQNNKKAVVLIDEAQMLQTKEIMEEFRGLLNLEVPEGKLVTFVFFGLPDLEVNLMLDEPLVQRVSIKYRIDSFSEDSTEAYIKHRLRFAGCSQDPFTNEAIKLIHNHSKGIPRMINIIADNALFEGFLMKQRIVEENIIEAVVADLGLTKKDKLLRSLETLTAKQTTRGVREERGFTPPPPPPPAPAKQEEPELAVEAEEEPEVRQHEPQKRQPPPPRLEPRRETRREQRPVSEPEYDEGAGQETEEAIYEPRPAPPPRPEPRRASPPPPRQEARPEPPRRMAPAPKYEPQPEPAPVQEAAVQSGDFSEEDAALDRLGSLESEPQEKPAPPPPSRKQAPMPPPKPAPPPEQEGGADDIDELLDSLEKK
jgi:general secretion pathway protein A